MNSTHLLPSFPAPARPASARLAPPASAAETLQSRFAMRVASRLNEGAESLSPDIAERLRFAREQALLRARAARPASAATDTALTRRPGAALGGWRSGWRLKFAGLVPMMALVGGLVLIQQWQDNTQVTVAAEIDAALLSDDLPPTAYSDAGFVEYLKTPNE